MTNLFKKIITGTIVILFFGGMVFYGSSKIRDLANGPVLKYINTEDSAEYTAGLFILEGTVKNTTKLNINQRPII